MIMLVSFLFSLRQGIILSLRGLYEWRFLFCTPLIGTDLRVGRIPHGWRDTLRLSLLNTHETHLGLSLLFPPETHGADSHRFFTCMCVCDWCVLLRDIPESLSVVLLRRVLRISFYVVSYTFAYMDPRRTLGSVSISISYKHLDMDLSLSMCLLYSPRHGLGHIPHPL